MVKEITPRTSIRTASLLPQLGLPDRDRGQASNAVPRWAVLSADRPRLPSAGQALQASGVMARTLSIGKSRNSERLKIMDLAARIADALAAMESALDRVRPSRRSAAWEKDPPVVYSVEEEEAIVAVLEELTSDAPARIRRVLVDPSRLSEFQDALRLSPGHRAPRPGEDAVIWAGRTVSNAREYDAYLYLGDEPGVLRALLWQGEHGPKVYDLVA